MVVNKRNFYIIRKSNGVVWNFLCDENMGIIYRILIDDRWSDYNMLTNSYVDDFYIALLPNDFIYILYKDLSGNIMLKIHDGLKWSKEKIIQSFQNPMLEINFKSISLKNEIHIVYCILNKKSKNITMFHQKIDESLKLSDSKIIDTINFSNNLSFNLSVLKNHDLFIVYEKPINGYNLGYRILNKENGRWSNFYIIDENKEPLKDYSFLPLNNTLCVLAIKKEERTNSLLFYEGNLSNFKCNKIFEGNNLTSCSLAMIGDKPFGSWINSNDIYYNFFIKDAESIIVSPYREILPYVQVIKAKYISKDFHEIYLRHEDDLAFLMDIENYSPTLNKYIINCMKENCEKITYYIDTIDKLKKVNLSQANKLNSIREEFKIFNDNKHLLAESINFLQKNLADKEEEIKKLNEKIESLNSPLKRFFKWD
ncbi:hypothetical protein CLLI_06680 [Clostridium liquoris]|jgi:hypothetical protein|uniref:Uncharacterized protein n=1 Tax=Clostridium liquoris TaxID=1289519 RepID=A0A2T0B7V5_9CLOT|nr:hypothetical protein [Clostridium liquoris]PRR79935.1 hypothetical protein CLLI_06680 [Clostridium liquoris]